MKKFLFFLICIPCFFHNTLFAQQWTGTNTPSSTISRTGEVGIGLSSATWSGATSSSTRQMLTVDAGTTGYAASKAGIFLNRSNRSTGVLGTGVYLGELNAYSAHSWGTAVLAQMDITSTYNPYSTSVARLGGGSFTCNLANNISSTNGTTEIYGLYANLISSNPSAITTFPTNGYMAALVANDGINKPGTLAFLSTGKIRFQELPLSNTNNQILTSDPVGNVYLRDINSLYTAGNGISINNGTIENIGDLSLVGHDLILSSDATSVDLSPYMQTLSITGNVISLTNGGSVTLPAVPVYTAGTGISLVGNVISNTLPNYFTANGPDIYNNNTGNVRFGPGPNAPTNKVEINSGTVGASGLSFTNLKSTSPTVATNGKVLTVDATGKVILALDNAGTADWSRVGNGNTNPASNFIGTTDAKDFVMRTTNLERMRILANGNVAIGTPTPTAQFHTTGSVRFQGLTNNNTNTQILSSDATGNLSWRDASTLGATYTAGAGISIANNVISSNLVSSQWSPSSAITNVTPNSNIITYDGRIAVGELCTNANINKYPSNYSGYFGNAGILASGLRIANICDPLNWADFVFEKDYHLPSLKSEKEYIEKNGHLRDLPSSKEIAENGIDVAKMFKVQMQKIEELTLHAIALSEKLDKLQAENEALKAKLAK